MTSLDKHITARDMSENRENPEQSVDLPADMEVTLDDDKAVNSKEFKSGSLAIGEDGAAQQPPDVDFRGTRSSLPNLSNSEGAGPGLTRDRPFSASTRSRMSTKSVTSMNPSAVQTNFTVKTFFSYRVRLLSSCYVSGHIADAVNPAKISELGFFTL